MKKENIKPIGQNVLVMPLKAEKKTSSGIVLPETASAERSQEGKVIAIGDSEKIKVKKGQTIIFAKYSGSEIKADKDECILIKAEDILAIVE
ncbi:MAG: co-chaperone GroES [Candidatus Moranbacteria bacterium]|nr:co-chaperone GroES [Candidatus Moranbacteria bacterium]